MSIRKLKFDKEKNRHVILRVIKFPRKKNLVDGYVYRVDPYMVHVDELGHPQNVFTSVDQMNSTLGIKSA